MIKVHVNRAEQAGVGGAAVRRAVVGVLEHGGVRTAEVSVTFLDDDTIRGLNKSYLGHDWPTDVLSFAIPGREQAVQRADEPDLMGDIYIGADRLDEQARERGITPLEEAIRLAVHGSLHLLGKDHPEGEDREGSPFFEEQEAFVSRVLAEEADG